jgi:hypothetical protein
MAQRILIRRIPIMNRWIAILALIALTWTLAGCDNSDQPKKDPEGKAIKAPDVPPTGV